MSDVQPFESFTKCKYAINPGVESSVGCHCSCEGCSWGDKVREGCVGNCVMDECRQFSCHVWTDFVEKNGL